MRNMIKNSPLLLIAMAIFFSGCVTPQVAINPRADFSAINRVAVITFTGNKGNIAADLMTQSLLANGIDVIERQQLNSILKEHQLMASGNFDRATAKKIGKLLGVDALFLGSVVETTPASSYLINTKGKRKNVNQVAGSTIRSDGPVMGVPNSHLITTAASTALISRMVDIETGSVLWSASMSYDGFDITSAMSGITRAFVRSLIPIWPAILKPL